VETPPRKCRGSLAPKGIFILGAASFILVTFLFFNTSQKPYKTPVRILFTIMEVIIERKDISNLVTQEKTIWRSFVKNKIRQNVILAIPAILLFLDALDRYSKTGVLTGISFTICLALAISIVVNLIYTFYSRYKTIKDTQIICRNGSQYNEPSTITITDWGVRVKAYSYNSEHSWSYFRNYKLKGNLLIIYSIHYSLQSIVLEKSEITNEEYENLISLINKRLPSSKKNGI
jgi:hypothetical protein